MQTKPTITHRWILAAIMFLLLASFNIQAQESADALHAGVGRIDITPKEPVTLSGYGSRKDLSKGVHDPLSARVVAFESNGKRLVLVSTDLLGFYGGTAEQYKHPFLITEIDFDKRIPEVPLQKDATPSA